MTSSLVRKGLELFSDDLCTDEAKLKDKTGLKAKQKTSKKHGQKKQTITKKKVQSALDLYVHKQAEDQTQSNLAYFISTGKYNAANYDQIITHLKGRMAKNQSEKVIEEEAGGFTEEDFAAFEKEYK